MSKIAILTLWGLVFSITFAAVFFLDNGPKKYGLSRTGVTLSSVVERVEKNPTDSRSFHIVSYEFQKTRYTSKLSGASGYSVGETEEITIDAREPDIAFPSEGGNSLFNLLLFCFIAGIFMASAVATAAWRKNSR